MHREKLTFSLVKARRRKVGSPLAEDSAIEKHFKKEALDDMRNELRSMFLLYGKAGQWERLQSEIARERAAIKKELKIQQKIKDRNTLITVVTAILTVSFLGIVGFVKFLKGTL